MHRTPLRRLWVLAVLAWLAQLCAPMAHAATLASAPAGMPGWCGAQPSPAAAAAIAQLPAELRDALLGSGDASKATASHLSNCAQLCVACSLAAPPLRISPTVALRLASLEAPLPAPRPAPTVRQAAAPPPAHGPPTIR